jgi:hypothetical protein
MHIPNEFARASKMLLAGRAVINPASVIQGSPAVA